MMHLLTPLIAISLILVTTSCTSPNIISPLPEKVKEIEVQIKEIERHVPPEFLIKCDWLAPIEEDTQSSLLETNMINADRLIECYLRHNSWVEWQTNNQESER